MADPDASFSFTRVLDLQADLGVDPTANERIDGILESNLTDGTLIEVPSGTYRLGDFSMTGNNVGVRGVGSTRPTLVQENTSKPWIDMNGSNLLFENFTLGDGSAGMHAFKCVTGGPWVIRNVEKRGLHHDENGGWQLGVTDSGSTGLIDQCVCLEGNADSFNGRGSVGIFANRSSTGELIIRDCELHRFADNGIYASSAQGPVKVIRGFYKNNTNSSVRLGSDGSVARGVVIVHDARGPSRFSSYSKRGFWIYNPVNNLTIENCDLLHSGPDINEAVIFDGNSTGAFENNRIQHDSGSHIAVQNPGSGMSGSTSHLSGAGDLTAPGRLFECIGSGCDAPRTTAREPTGGGGGETSQPPVASFSYTVGDGSVSVDASATADPDTPASELAYQWDFGDGSSALGLTAANTYADAGDYTVTLTVTDPEGNTDTASEVVSVPIQTEPPSATFTASTDSLSVAVDASATTDPDTPVSELSYQWDFGDGSGGMGASAMHTYDVGGEYTITLTVSDPDGNTSTSSAVVTVSPPVGDGDGDIRRAALLATALGAVVAYMSSQSG